MVAGPTFSGFDRIDVMMAADRHFDLAVLHRSVHDLLGPEAVFRLYDAYGLEPDLIRLDHYILASHLIVEPSASPIGVDGQAEA
jgi:aminoglycoside phosphotransferase